MLQVEILTLFPRMCEGYLAESVLGKARERGLIEAVITDIRQFASGPHRTTDDAPYGGGAGMVMKPEPLAAAIDRARERLAGAKVILTSPRGERLDQGLAGRLAEAGRLVLVCGRYEGVDERIKRRVDMEVSVGDFVLTGGELAALCIADAAARLIPGVLGNADSTAGESFAGGELLLEHPQYTRPPVFEGMEVPPVLLSGDHGRVARWRRRESLRLTRERRPDLYARLRLSEGDKQLVEAGDDEI